MKIRKIALLIIFFQLFFTTTTICRGGFDIYPRELTITMYNKFIQGNTSRDITIINVNDDSINITWYLDHPNPISWIRPNRTLIPKLTWVDVKPKFQIIPPKGSAKFDIYLGIPNKEENLKKQWETWIVFKEEENKFINIESTVRLLIDTPSKLQNNNQNQDFLSIKIGDDIKIPLSDILLISSIIILVILSLLIIKRKKQNKT